MKKIDELTPEERAEYARVLLMAQKPAKPPFVTKGWPKYGWQIVPGFLGLPVEREPRPIRHPLIIISFIALFIALQIHGARVGLQAFVHEYGFIPYYWYRHFFTTMISSFFLHGGWFHLLGNAYYFYVFGDDVEDELHLPKFLTLLIGSHVAGLLAHAILAYNSLHLPLVGASAGISGLMGYYMVRYPKRHISYMVNLFFVIIYWFHVPAFVALLVKFGWELFFLAPIDASGVAHWAHLGGAFFGISYALWQRQLTNPPQMAQSKSKETEL